LTVHRSDDYSNENSATKREGFVMAQPVLSFPRNVSTFGQVVAGALGSRRSVARTLRAAGRAEEERAALTQFAAYLNSLGDLDETPPAVRSHILEAIKTVIGRVDLERCSAGAAYGRRLLHEDLAGWSLAAISLRPGQATPSHDHGGWGCAVTVQGVERDRRFVDVGGGILELVSEHDYPPGTGYSFGPTDIHQPVGADPSGLTVALHFLVHGRQESTQLHAETKPHAHHVRTDTPLLEDAA
jgi:predicted metal-dependent enzyme (double-stranded beta helix superfamily)